MLTPFLAAVGLGIAMCLPPGAVTAEAIRRGLAQGFRGALLLEFGSLIGDATWAAIALVGVAFLAQNALARVVLGGIGTVLMLWLAVGALSAARSADIPKVQPSSSRNSFTAGAALSLSNPQTVAFWLTVGGGVIGEPGRSPQPIDVATFFAGFMLACVGWCFFFSALVAWGRRLLTPPFFRAVNLLCGIALGYFGILLFLRTAPVLVR
jgi:chemosensory pili system protein ChpE